MRAQYINMGFEWMISKGCLINELILKGCPINELISKGCPICFDIGGLSTMFCYRRVVQYVFISKGCPICFDIGGLSNMF